MRSGHREVNVTRMAIMNEAIRYGKNIIETQVKRQKQK